MWALTNYDGTLKEERYATYDLAAEAYTTTFLLSAYSIVKVD